MPVGLPPFAAGSGASGISTPLPGTNLSRKDAEAAAGASKYFEAVLA
jgi:hypothetical protein